MWKQAGEHNAQCGHADAHYGDVGLGGGPDDYVGLVPGGITRRTEVHERLQADDGYDSDAGRVISGGR